MGGTEHLEGMIPLEPTPQLQLWPKTLSDLQVMLQFNLFFLMKQGNVSYVQHVKTSTTEELNF